MASKDPVQEWPIKRLKAHPRQAELFSDLPDVELDALAGDIERNGLQHPVEVLSDGTLVGGHQRLRAVTKLGWKKVWVVVRSDLEKEGQLAVERYLVTDNLHRRQLGPLARAKAIRALVTIEVKIAGGGRHLAERIKEAVARQFQMSPRNVSRYLAVLDVPAEVQEAFDRGALSLVKAGRVATLSRDEREAVVDRLRAGEPPDEVVDEVLGGSHSQGTRSREMHRVNQRVLRLLRRDARRMKESSEEIALHNLARHLAVMRVAHEALEAMIARAETYELDE